MTQPKIFYSFLLSPLRYAFRSCESCDIPEHRPRGQEQAPSSARHQFSPAHIPNLSEADFTSRSRALHRTHRQPPPGCRRKSSSALASPSASMPATYVFPHPPTPNSEAQNAGNSLTTSANEQKVTPRQPKPRVSRMKGHLSKRTAFVRDVVKEVSGYVERGVLEGMAHDRGTH